MRKMRHNNIIGMSARLTERGRPMNFLKGFFKQSVPKAGTEMPAYYRSALVNSEWLLAAYYVLTFFLMARYCSSWEIVPIVLVAVIALCLIDIDNLGPRVSLGIFSVATIGWCAWYVYKLGWGTGVQHFLAPLMVLLFFNVFEPPALKIAGASVLLVFRLLLFAFSHVITPRYTVTEFQLTVLQLVNSVAMFSMLVIICIHFSTNLQDTERKLRIDNQELHREAGTDPLTQLPNRRAMMDAINAYIAESPQESFSIAIADIDFFKHINDTYGHPCGDYTLQQLSARFREAAGTEYRVCRWGGEEFCFFMPGKNLDDAGREMTDLNVAVSRMPLSFEGVDFSITITIGVEEYDFRSPIDDIIERADRKLYIGKETGRNKVVI